MIVTCAQNHPIWTSLFLLTNAIGPVGAAIFSVFVYCVVRILDLAVLVWALMLWMILSAEEELGSKQNGWWDWERWVMLIGRAMFIVGGLLLAWGLQETV